MVEQKKAKRIPITPIVLTDEEHEQIVQLARLNKRTVGWIASNAIRRGLPIIKAELEARHRGAQS